MNTKYLHYSKSNIVRRIYESTLLSFVLETLFENNRVRVCKHVDMSLDTIQINNVLTALTDIKNILDKMDTCFIIPKDFFIQNTNKLVLNTYFALLKNFIMSILKLVLELNCFIFRHTYFTGYFKIIYGRKVRETLDLEEDIACFLEMCKKNANKIDFSFETNEYKPSVIDSVIGCFNKTEDYMFTYFDFSDVKIDNKDMQNCFSLFYNNEKQGGKSYLNDLLLVTLENLKKFCELKQKTIKKNSREHLHIINRLDKFCNHFIEMITYAKHSSNTDNLPDIKIFNENLNNLIIK